MFARTGFALVIFVLLSMVAACSGDSVTSFRDASDDPAAEPGSDRVDGASVDVDMDEGAAERSGNGAAQITASDFDRRVIRSAELELRVSDVRASVRHARDLAADYGGHVESSTARALSEGDELADVTLEVPSNEFERVLDELREGPHVVEVDHESTSSRDVTEEYVDLRARLGNLESTESRYVALLDEAVNISDILSVENEISRVRGEIEQIQGRLNYLEQRTDYSRIYVAFYPHDDETVAIAGQHFTPGETAREAWNASMQFVGTIGNAIIAIAVFFWWGWPLAAIGALILFRYRRHRRVTTTPAQV